MCETFWNVTNHHKTLTLCIFSWKRQNFQYMFNLKSGVRLEAPYQVRESSPRNHTKDVGYTNLNSRFFFFKVCDIFQQKIYIFLLKSGKLICSKIWGDSLSFSHEKKFYKPDVTLTLLWKSKKVIERDQYLEVSHAVLLIGAQDIGVLPWKKIFFLSKGKAQIWQLFTGNLAQIPLYFIIQYYFYFFY